MVNHAREHTAPNADIRTGTLYLVATPIGNLADLSFRALEVLRKVDLIACEDTRHSRKLCSYYGIATPLISYYREKEQQRADQILGMLQAGKDIALITDAGTPALSDPGSVLVRLVRAAGIPLTAIPGASALTTALALAGLGESTFYFGAFLPATTKARQQALRSLLNYSCPLIFYEAPHRIHVCLQDMLQIFGDRPALLFRELTKLHEEHLSGSLSQLCMRVEHGVKGELVLVVAGCDQVSAGERPQDITAILRWHKDELGSTLKEAVSETAAELGLPRTRIYRAALALWQDKE
ncbi:MAG: 16S rRNA (cytidine(1402)-2'-O)-methyltransferase [Desulfobulbaceae bacterium]|nr:16S rRNA (cytidine(1402)-2'-O)-methyltransferase [Desulfobulbaceae bacterium]